MKKIDAVIMWVDGNDQEWLKEKKKYCPEVINDENNNSSRFRDWDNLHYFFRGLEKNADWINNIYFITWGHLPSWLNTENPKLKIVKHSDFIPKEYLPTYNSSIIELNLFRIKELSDNFILFNDDMFVLNKVKPEDFFINDFPCDSYSESIMSHSKPNDVFFHILFNNMCMINKYFNKSDMYKKDFRKYFSFKYGLKNISRSFALKCFNHFSYINNNHLANPLKKSVMKKIWELEPELLHQSSLNKFRSYNDFNQYLVRYFQICSGNFVPRKNDLGKYFELNNTNKDIIKKIKKHNYKLVCLNDTANVEDFETSKTNLNNFLESIFPEKSSFEK